MKQSEIITKMDSFTLNHMMISLFNRLKTSNIFLNMFLMLFFTNLMKYINNQNLRKYIDLENILFNLINYVKYGCKKYNILFENVNYTNEKNKYTMSYLSVIDFVINQKNINLKSLSEIDSESIIKNTAINTNNILQIKDFVFTINKMNKNILIEKDIYISFHSDEYKNSAGELIKRTDIIEIFSYKYNVDELKKYVKEKCYEPYVRKFEENLIGNLYLFIPNKTKFNNIEYLTYNKKQINSTKTFETIFFEEKNLFMEQLDFFINNKKWYQLKGIPYKLGIILHGYPGCGKTSIIKSILNYTQRHGIFINLNNINKESLIQQIFCKIDMSNHYIPFNKRVYIFEEIDICDVTMKRDKLKIINENEKNIDDNEKNDNKKCEKDDNDKLTLSTLLNLFDGIESNEDSIIILTTNHIEKIDPALIRPGRMDINIELKKCSKTIILEIMAHFYDVDILLLTEKYYDKIMDYTYSPAEIIQQCFKYKNDFDLMINKTFL